GQRARKGEGAGGVVVGDDEMVRAQRDVPPLVHIEIDRTELPHDPLIGPALERTAEIDTDQLAEHAGIDAFGIIIGYGRHEWLPWSQASRRPALHDFKLQLEAAAARLQFRSEHAGIDAFGIIIGYGRHEWLPWSQASRRPALHDFKLQLEAAAARLQS